MLDWYSFFIGINYLRFLVLMFNKYCIFDLKLLLYIVKFLVNNNSF